MKKILLILIITCLMSSSLFPLIESFYIAPKIIYNFNDSGIRNSRNQRVMNNYLGAGISGGFDFYRYQKSVPVRVELEYAFKDGMTGNYHLNNILKQSCSSCLKKPNKVIESSLTIVSINKLTLSFTCNLSITLLEQKTL